MRALTPLPSDPRVFPRLKFIWGAGHVIAARWRLGLFGFYSHAPGFPTSGFAISVRGLFAWLLALGLGGYAGAAAAVTWTLQRQPHNEVRFVDALLWPARRERIAQARGRAWLAQGRDALEARRWGEALLLLRRGLERCPDDFETRLILARFFLAGGDRVRGLALLADGPGHGLPSRTWREAALALTTAGEDWETALRLCDGCLPRLRAPEQWPERQHLLAQKCAALVGLGRAAEALTLTAAEGDDAALAVKTARVQALLALGRADEAATLCARWRVHPPSADQVKLAQLHAHAAREAGRLGEMERALDALQRLEPTRAEAAVFAVEQRTRAGRGAAALEDFLFRFGSRPGDLELAAAALADVPDVALVRRVAAAAAERGFSSRTLRTTLAFAQLRAGEAAEFGRTVASLAARPVPEAAAREWLAWAQSLATALNAPNANAGDPLVEFMRTHPLALATHRLTIAALHRAGRDEAADAVLAVSRRGFAESPSLRLQQAEVARALAAAPRPAPLPAPAPARLPADWHEFISPVDVALAAMHWTEARALLTQARNAPFAPDWVTAREADLLARELRIDHGLHDAPALRATAKLFVNGGDARIDDALGLAREWHAARADDDAVLLVRAVLEKSPGQPQAASLLAECGPRPPRVGSAPTK